MDSAQDTRPISLAPESSPQDRVVVGLGLSAGASLLMVLGGSLFARSFIEFD